MTRVKFDRTATRSVQRGVAIVCVLACFRGGVSAQTARTLTVEQCYQLAEATYPQTRQRGLIESTRDFTVENLVKGLYPQLTIKGAATYQSDATSLSIPKTPGSTLPSLGISIPKDQYQVYGEADQTLSDFGINRERRAISRSDADVQEENLNADLYQLRDRVNQLFFGVLLVDGQLEQNELSAQDLRDGIKNEQALIQNGTGFQSNLDKLQAQLLQTEQHSIELRATRRSYTSVLSEFINQPVDDSTTFDVPQPPQADDSIRRPEILSYDLQAKSYREQSRLTRLNTYPQLSVFFQGGMGQPSPVNLLKSQVSPFYITGLRLTWTFGNLYTYRKDQLINKNNEQMVEAGRSTFLFNTHMTMTQEDQDIKKYQDLIASDDEIVRLREAVKQASQAQLQNGVITANDYLLDIDAEAQAREDRAVHKIQLLISEYDHKTTSGN